MRSFYLRVISTWYAKIAVEDSVMKLEIVYALREQMSFRFQMHEILEIYSKNYEDLVEYEEDFKESYGFQYRTKGRSVVAERVHRGD